MSKSSRAKPTPDLVRELRDSELQEVSGGYVYDSTYVVGIVAAQTKTTTACLPIAGSSSGRFGSGCQHESLHDPGSAQTP